MDIDTTDNSLDATPTGYDIELEDTYNNRYEQLKDNIEKSQLLINTESSVLCERQHISLSISYTFR